MTQPLSNFTHFDGCIQDFHRMWGEEAELRERLQNMQRCWDYRVFQAFRDKICQTQNTAEKTLTWTITATHPLGQDSKCSIAHRKFRLQDTRQEWHTRCPVNLFEQFAKQYVKNINTEQRIYKPRTEVVGKTFAVNKRHNKKVVQIKFALSNRIADLSKCECDYSVNNVP